MSDKELLELAAKAAGFRIRGWIGEKFYVINGWDPAGHYDPFPWNPLEDDGQALRLAVMLQLTVCNEHISAGVAYCMRGLFDSSLPEVRSGTKESHLISDDYAATRRAIVSAAAEIARTQAQ